MLHLETERLTVRGYTLDDLQTAHRIRVECFESTAPLNDTQDYLDWTVRNYRELAKMYQPPYGDYAVVLKNTDTVIGAVGLVPSVIPWGVLGDAPPTDADLRVQPEFGLYWATLPEYQRSGYAVEAAAGIIAFLFGTLAARRVVATTEFTNHASQAVMRRLGMTVQRNTWGKPFWFEVVGVLENRL